MPDNFSMPLGAESLGNVSVSDMQSPAARQSRGRASDSPQHFEFVDALRGFAILGVIMIHCLLYLKKTHWRVHQFGLQGAHGVQLFFVVSAFTLFWSLQSRIESERRPLFAFYIRRFFRIAPLFYLAAVFYTAQHWGDPTDGYQRGPLQFLATLLFLHGWHPASINAIVPGGWSIGAEFMFYLCIPLLFRYIRSLSAALWLTLISTILVSALTPAAMTAVIHHYHHIQGSEDVVRGFAKEVVYFSFPAQLPVFSLGFVLYFLLRDRISGNAIRSSATSSFTRPGKGTAFFLVALALFLIFGEVPDHILASVAFVALAYGLSIFPFPLAVNRVTRFIGTVSFSAYIWHFWVLKHIHHLVFKLMGGHVNDSIRFAVLTLATIALTIPISALTYYFIEVPGQNFGKYLIARYGWGKRTWSSPTPARAPSSAVAVGA